VVRNRTHTRIQLCLRMTDTVTSQDIDLSSRDIPYNVYLSAMNESTDFHLQNRITATDEVDDSIVERRH
jgi:hypothetical protein